MYVPFGRLPPGSRFHRRFRGAWIPVALLLAVGCGNGNPSVTPSVHQVAPSLANSDKASATGPDDGSTEVSDSSVGLAPTNSNPAVDSAKTTGDSAAKADAAAGLANQPVVAESLRDHVAALQKLGAEIEYGVGDRIISVDLGGKPVADADLMHLAPLTEVKSLNLSETAISDAGLAQLAQLKKLKFLYLFKTNVTDAGAAELTALPRLEVLCLDRTLITDVGVKSLEELPRLEKLHMHSRLPITDAGLESLKKHVRLFELKIGGPQITEQGIKGLKEALPNCKIIYDPAEEAKEG